MDEASRKKPLLGSTLAELTTLAMQYGMPTYAGQQMARWLYQKGATTLDAMTDLRKVCRARLSEEYVVGRMAPVAAQRSKDGTVKYLFPTFAGQHVETVFIPEGERATLCVSCQVGCKMGCAFCQTGRQGFGGQLSAGDILNQVYSLPEREQLTNIVFMGQGEPLDNLDSVLRATEILQASYALAWSPKRITVSTVGLRHKLRHLIENSACHLAISLHAARHDVRQRLLPAERGMTIEEIVQLLRCYDFSHQRRLTFEYTMIDGVNDSGDDAKALVALLKGMVCRVNLIRLHESDAVPFRCATPAAMEAMNAYLNRHGIPTTTRQSRGEDIAAACGQLTTAATNNTNNDKEQ